VSPRRTVHLGATVPPGRSLWLWFARTARLATLTPEQQLLGAVDLNTGVISYTSQPPTATAGSVTTFEPEILAAKGYPRAAIEEVIIADTTTDASTTSWS
jgi:hypothetical protein